MPEKAIVDDKTVQEVFDAAREKSIADDKTAPLPAGGDAFLEKVAGEIPAKDVEPGVGATPATDEEKAAVEKEKIINEILDDYGFDSLEEMKSVLGESANIKGLLEGKDIKDIVRDANALREYEEKLENARIAKLEGDEEPDETIARLKRENAAIKTQRNNEEAQRADIEASRNRVTQYEREVVSMLDKKAMPAELKELYLGFLGVDNPVLDVDLNNRAAVKGTIRAQIDKLDKLIADRGKSTTVIPAISRVNETAGGGTLKETLKTLGDSRRVATDYLARALFKK